MHQESLMTSTQQLPSDDIQEFLKITSMAMRDRPIPEGYRYRCISDCILEHGMQFTKIGRRPKYIKMGKPRHCYMNAAQLALSTSDLIYCEGYAVGFFPVLHAWVCTKNGTVIDNTWKDGTAYYGIPFKRSYLMKIMQMYGTYGIIEQFGKGHPCFPVLRDNPETFLYDKIRAGNGATV